MFDFPLTRTTVFTFGAGVQWFEAYEAGQQHHRLIVGGISARGSVGAAGGWLQGGGHSLISPNYGLGRQKLLFLIPPESLTIILQASTTSWR
jgi:hypothetical protein